VRLDIGDGDRVLLGDVLALALFVSDPLNFNVSEHFEGGMG
jgi:hypothetical protein